MSDVQWGGGLADEQAWSRLGRQVSGNDNPTTKPGLGFDGAGWTRCGALI